MFRNCQKFIAGNFFLFKKIVSALKKEQQQQKKMTDVVSKISKNMQNHKFI